MPWVPRPGIVDQVRLVWGETRKDWMHKEGSDALYEGLVSVVPRNALDSSSF